jgi:hypothetical protein
MTFLKEQAIRLLRTKWNSAQELAEELFAIFNNDRPMVVDGDLTVNGKITSNKDGQTTTIDPTVPDPAPDPVPPPPASVLFGDGADGDVTVNAEITLSRDMFYENLTLDSSAKINTNNYRIFVSGTLDLTNASANAINNNGIDGSYKDGETVPASGWYLAVNSLAVEVAHTCGTGCRSGAGAESVPGPVAGGNATPQPAYTGIGGRSGPGGKGGDSNSPAVGGAGGAGQLCSGQNAVNFAQNTATYFTGTSYDRLQGGAGGGGGGSGGGYGLSSFGSSGAAGGAGGGVVVLLAKTIQVGSQTAAGAVSANGGKGGRAPYPGEGGVSLPGGGAGGGGGGGGGGYIYLVYGEILGTASSNWVRANGGKGGKGGDGTASGNSGLGGQGGNGGGSGSITYINYYTNEVTQQAKSSGIGDTPSIPVRSEGSQGSNGITNEASPK